MSYFHCVGSEPLKPQTIGEIFDITAAKWPNRTAVKSFHEDKEFSFRELCDEANKFTKGLAKLGVQRGSKIGLLAGNSSYWYITIIAAAKLGAVLVPFSPSLEVNELETYLEKVPVKVLLIDEKNERKSYYQMIKSLKERQDTPVFLIEMSHIIMFSDTKYEGILNYCDVLNLSSNCEISCNVQPDDPFALLFSSGSTGTPKLTILTHFTFVNNSYLYGKRAEIHKTHHTLCLQAPLFHVFGLAMGVIAAINYGMTIAIPSPSFKARLTLKAIENYNMTIIMGTPTMFLDLCKYLTEDIEFSQCKDLIHFNYAVCGGSTVPITLHKKMKEILRVDEFQVNYGLSETAGAIFQHNKFDDYETKINSVGSVAEHTEVKVVDKLGRMVPFGKPGELWVRRFTLSTGYWQDEMKTRDAFTPCGWFKTGDLFILNERGYGSIIGRIKEIINRGGEKIVPSEVENVLIRHPDVSDAQVYGISDERLGEMVAAAIKLNQGSYTTKDSIYKFCKGKIAYFKIPEHIRFVDNFPQTQSGKISKLYLRQSTEEDIRSSGSYA